MDFETAKKRSEIIKLIRTFFSNREYLEVDTPLLAPGLIPETTIEIFKTRFLHPDRESESLYLIPSPEVFMKQLLGMGSGSIFQICKSFRNSEQISQLHNIEFTMLEWYTVNANYIDSMQHTEELIKSIDQNKIFSYPFQRITMNEAFKKYAGFSLENNSTKEALYKQADRLDLFPSKEDDIESLFNKIFISLVEPALPTDKPLFLMDYPAFIPTLSKKSADGLWNERWELYIDGIEIANCFTEMHEKVEIEEFFAKELEIKNKIALEPIDSYPHFADTFTKKYPEASGVALGVDRLIMLLAKKKSIQGVIFFPFSDIVGRSKSK